MRSAVLLTSSGHTVGLGHLSRMEALAEAFRSRGIEPSLCVDDHGAHGETESSRIRNERWTSDAARASVLAADADLVVLDAYQFAEAVWRAINQVSRYLVVFDDVGEKPPFNGVLVNGSPGAETIAYRPTERQILLLGPAYQVLRPPFWLPPPKKPIATAVDCVGVAVGGGQNVAHRRIRDRIVAIATQRFHRTVVLGPVGKEAVETSFPHRVSYTGRLNAEGVRDFFDGIDLLISAGGQTLAEAASRGVPTIGFSIVSNQSANLAGWARLGTLRPLGSVAEFRSINEFESALEAVICDLTDPVTRSRQREAGRSARIHASTNNLVDFILSHDSESSGAKFDVEQNVQ